MPRKTSRARVPFGKKIKKARLDKKITFNNLANETGFSVDYLKDIEGGKVIPPVGALLQISRALMIDSDTLLIEQEATLKNRVKAFTKRTENYDYTTLTPGAENKHLKAFKVTVKALQEHKPHGLFLENLFGFGPGEFELSHFLHASKFGFGFAARHFLDTEIDQDRDEQSQATSNEEDIPPADTGRDHQRQDHTQQVADRLAELQ